MRRMVSFARLLALLPALAACSPAPSGPGQRYDVGGHALYMVCSGSAAPAQPTVIIEGGLGSMTPFYAWIQQGVARFARVCSYDRAGLGWSDDSDKPHDAAESTRQLHALLAAAGVRPPYVLAGHSLAGLLMPVYADTYPDEVAGLVFLDPSHPRQWAALPGGEDGVAKGKRLFRLLGYAAAVGATHLYNPLLGSGGWFDRLPAEAQLQLRRFGNQSRTYFTAYAEFDAFAQSAREAAAVTSFGDRPLVVVTAGRTAASDGAALATADELGRVLQQLHGEIAALSTRGRHVIVAGATHMTLIADARYADQAVDEIRRVVAEATPPAR
jgi:pimeloyl-ACP methyl ester carboxylesterase